MKFFYGQDVVVRGIGTGVISNVREDDNKVPIYTVALDDVSLTPDGLFVARTGELEAQ